MRNRAFRQSLLGALSLTAMIVAVEPAAAQQATAAADSPDAGDSNDIIVSARRRDEALQDTPVAITAINAAMLENKATTNIGDLQGAAPNLLITQQNSGAQAANLSIRGLTYADIEKSQEPTVGVVVDGVFIGTNTGQLLDFFDIEQIEVLRGPQGTLFGRNTIGGVINIRRTRPTMETGAKLEGSYGKFNTWSGRAVVNLGLGDTIGVKGFYFHSQTDGFYRNAISGKRAGGSNNENFGASILVKPPEADWDFLLTLEKQQQKFEPVNSNITRTGEAFCALAPAGQCNRNTTTDLYTVFTQPATSRYSAPSVTGELNWDLGGVNLTSITGYRKSREFQTQDFDGSSVDLYYVLRRQRYYQFSQEIRFAGNITDNFDYVVGGYYFKSRYSLTQFTRVFAFAPDVSPDVFDKNAQSVVGRNESFAGFGDFNLSLTDQLRVSFGARYTRDKKSLRNSFATTGLVGQGSGTFNKLTPKVGVDYRPNEDTLLYASWSRGYRSGGFSARAATATTASTPFGPETVDSYEIGTKLDLLDRKLQFNVAAFISKYDNLQQNTTIPGGPTGNQTITSNVGSATIKGIEIDAALRPTEGLRLTATMGILDSKFKGFIAGNSIGNVLPTFIGTTPAGAAAVLGNMALSGAYTATPTLLDYSANNLIYSPKFSGSLGADYNIPTSFGEVIANVGYRYIGRYDQQISLGPITGTLPDAAVVGGAVVVTQPASPLVVNGNDPRVRTDKQGLLDASLTAKFKLAGTEAYFTVFGRNLANDKGTTAAFTVAGLFSFASAREPRTYGATFGVKF